MSDVIFQFDAETAGLIAGVNAAISAFGALQSAVEGIASSFVNIASQSETVTSSWTQLVQNIGQLSGASDTATSSLGGSSKAASDLAYQLQQLGQRASDAAQAHQQATQEIQQQEQDLTATTQQQIAQRTATYNDSLQTLVQNHQDAITQITESEQQLTETYQEQIDKRLIKLNDPHALANQQITQSIEQQIDALLATGNTAGVASLQNQLQQQQTKYQQYIQNTIEPYYQSIDTVGYDHYKKQLDALQDKLDKENTKYDQQTAKLKNTYDDQLTNLQTSYKKQEDALADHLTKENEAYAKQVRDIAEQRQHLLDNASAGGGGGGGGGSSGGVVKPPTAADFIQLFKDLGIDPKKNPIAAADALQNWIVPAGGGKGQASKTQMTIQQIQGLVGQALALGQDPTRMLSGGENYVDKFADLLAYTGASAPTRMSDASRYSSLVQIMEKAMTGNTTGVMLQLQRLGLGNPDQLRAAGLKLGGTKGETIENPDQLLNALMNIASTQAPGLGQKQASNTLSGIFNNFKDSWTGLVQGIIGDPSNPDSLGAKFNVQLNRLLDVIYSHAPDLLKAGQSIGEFLLTNFTKFVDFLESKQFASMLQGIATAFHAIGDALEWMGQHKDIVMLVLGLLAAQVGGKVAGGAFNGLTNIGASAFKGGPLGAVMSGAGMIGNVVGGAGGSSGLWGGLLSRVMGAGGGIGTLANLTDDTALDQGLAEVVRKQLRRQLANAFNEGEAGVNLFQDVAGDKKMSKFGSLPDPLKDLPAWRQATTSPLADSGLVNALGGNLGAEGKLAASVAPSLAGNVAGAAEGAAGGGGGLLSGLLGGARGLLGGVGGSIGGAVGAVSTFASGGPAGIMAGMGAALPSLSALGPALAAIGAAAAPIAIVAGAIGGLILLLVTNREKIKPFIDQLSKFFGEQLKQATKTVTDFVHGALDRLADALQPGAPLRTVLDIFAKFWAGAWGGIKTLFTGVWNVISGAIQIAWSIISGIINIGLDLLGGKWSKAWTDFQTMISGVWNGILKMIQGVGQTIWGAITGIFGGIWNVIKGPLDTLGKSISGFFGDLATPIGKALGFFQTIFKTPINWIIDGLNFLINALDKIHFDLPSWVPGIGGKGFAINIPTIAHLETGGPVNAGDPYLIGERGPELFFSGNSGMVISNAQIRAALAGAGSSNVNNAQAMMFTGDIHLHGVQNLQDLYNQLNKYAGNKAEYGLRAGALA